MNQLSLHYVNQADREREIAEDLRNRQILDNRRSLTTTGRSAQTTRAEASGASAPDARPIPVRARAAGR